MSWEIILVDSFDGEAREIRGPIESFEAALNACHDANKEYQFQKLNEVKGRSTIANGFPCWLAREIKQ